MTRDKRKMWYDHNAVDRQFKTGDKVLVLVLSKPNKLSLNCIGLGIIEKQISETNYVVNVPGRRSRKIYHINLMKLYVQ